MSRLLYAAILLIAFTFSVNAGQITYSSRATIFSDDVRTAQRNALHNALLGGIRSYINANDPHHKGEINSDYFMFINSYTITKRELVDNSIIVTVQIEFNDFITEDVGTFMAVQSNSAVFAVTGLPDYVDYAIARRNISDIFIANQFSVNDQIAFEQEVVDITRRSDVLTAFQAVSSQYLFDLKFSVKSFKAGETCTLAGESSYIASNNLTKIVPIISTEVSVDDEDPVACIISAMNTSIETALLHVRDKYLPAPDIGREIYKYTLHFEDIKGLRDVTELLQSLTRRRFLIKYEMTEFYSDQALFVIECYLEPEDMAEKIVAMDFPSVKDVLILDDEITLKMQAQTTVPQDRARGTLADPFGAMEN